VDATHGTFQSTPLPANAVTALRGALAVVAAFFSGAAPVTSEERDAAVLPMVEEERGEQGSAESWAAKGESLHALALGRRLTHAHAIAEHLASLTVEELQRGVAAWAAWLPSPPPAWALLAVTPGAAASALGDGGRKAPRPNSRAAAAWEAAAWQRVCARVREGAET
jgi:hypothetical protein